MSKYKLSHQLKTTHLNPLPTFHNSLQKPSCLLLPMYQNHLYLIAHIHFLPRSIIQELSIQVYEPFEERMITVQDGEARIEGSM
jgi:hypothetical protein